MDTQNSTPKKKVEPVYDDGHGGITFEVVEEQIKEDGEHTVSRGVYLVPNMITTLSLLSGFFSILSSMQGDFYKAALAIFLSAILDGMDGRVARMLNAQSPFGEQFDSLADMLAFGAAPAILMYSCALKPLGRIGVALAFVFTACAAFRLARFNVQINVVDKKYFIGLASPLAALLVTSFVVVSLDYAWLQIYGTTMIAISAFWVVVCGLLMVSNVKYYSFKAFDRQRVPFWVLILGVVVLAAALYDIPMGILVIGTVYALSGFYTSFIAK
ncbi:MAG: CDP-diacylglycerol--serine O-phosphatidyltransferase [Gammaproteobacteria bacterium]|nr:MAG: CDP-diacylglycerol--serine O-phosphatidyltransferase [Gammaproteobacteria bacterium]